MGTIDDLTGLKITRAVGECTAPSTCIRFYLRMKILFSVCKTTTKKSAYTRRVFESFSAVHTKTLKRLKTLLSLMGACVLPVND